MAEPGEAAVGSDCDAGEAVAGALAGVAGVAACVVQAETGTSFEGLGTGEGLAGALDALAAPGAGADCLAGGNADVLTDDVIGDGVGTEDTTAAIAGIATGDGAFATRSDATFNVRFAPESLLGGVGGRVAPGTPPDCR